MTSDTHGEQAKRVIERLRERSEDPTYLARCAVLRELDAGYAASQAEADRSRRLLAAGIPLSLWPMLRKPRPTAAVTAVGEFLTGSPACVFLALAGPAGVGKTVASAYAVDRAGGRYITTSELVSAGTFGQGADLWRDLEHANLVSIDELGSEYRNESFDSSLYSLLVKRHARQLRTVLATNLDTGAFAARYCPAEGDPLRDRIATCGRWVNIPGESMRHHWSTSENPNED